MKNSYSEKEIEHLILEKQKEGRKVIDHLYHLFVENQFIDFAITKTTNGYSLESDEISYLFEEELNDYSAQKLTVLQRGQAKKTYNRDQILEIRNGNGGFRVSLGEFFIYIPTLI